MTRFVVLLCIVCMVLKGFSEEKKPRDGITLLKEAVFQERVTKDYPKAVELYGEILKRNDVRSTYKDKARLGLAVCQMHLKDVDEAVKNFAEVFKKTPRLAEAFLKESTMFPGSSYFEGYLKTKKTVEESALAKRMSKIVIKKIACVDMKVSTLFKQLRKLSKEHDPTGEGINFNVRIQPIPIHPVAPPGFDEEDMEGEGFDLEGEDEVDLDEKKDGAAKEEDHEKEEFTEPTITMDFDNIPLNQALRYICEQADLKYRLEGNVVNILSPNFTTDKLYLRFFPIDPDMAGHGGPEGVDFKTVFEAMGVAFPYRTDGSMSSISYDRGTNQLIVRNSKENLLLMERILRRLCMTLPQVQFTQNLVEVDVKEHDLARIKPDKLDEFITNLPETRLKILGSRTQLLHSGQEGYFSTKEDVEWNGGNGYMASDLTLTPQVAADNLSISTSIHWTSKIWPSKGDYLKSLSMEEENAPTVSPDLEADVRSDYTLWDQESVCVKIAPAKPHLKRGALFMILKATIVDPAGAPVRDPKVPFSNYLGIQAIETGE